ncbi:MAG TPA: hypothetical protein VKA38_09665 [Draconibacterium sp.]|nr:hypothetical protein [Draconibacterium sp.]
MKTINLNDRVKYVGKTNSWTFEQDLSTNSKGTVVSIFDGGGTRNYQVKFDNGIKTTIDIEDLELEP